VVVSASIARVALPLGLRQTLLYRIPDALQGRVQPGCRVQVPLRGRRTFGYVVSCHGEGEVTLPKGGLRELAALEPEEPLLEGPLLRLVLWVADYYACPQGEVFEAALPAQVWKGPLRRPSAPEELAVEPEARIPRMTPHQAEAVQEVLNSWPPPRGAHPPVFLLQGVTGSGKTEVYLRIAESLLERGASTLVLVPEIAMGTQVVGRFRARLGERVGVFHSGIPAGWRRETWWRAREGRIQVLVGARSAVFVPLRKLGAVIVDEEHEPAYKQGEAPRYHGRDVALMRARLEGAVALLGSATPSLESRWHAERGKYRRLLMPQRVRERPAPQVLVVDLRRPVGAEARGEAADDAGGDGHRGALRPAPGAGGATGEGSGEPRVLTQPRPPGEVFSGLLLEKIQGCLERGEQAILFLNRRGHSTSVQCQACGFVFSCPHCSVVLTYHRQDATLRCHYCGFRITEIDACPDCGARDFLYGGFGTQRVEAHLRLHFPEARILRMDLDTTRRRGAFRKIIGAVERGEVDLLVGTQMVGKGLDFPSVTLVGVLLADREMMLPDFRSQERAFQILTQVAGRAGRGERPGEVVLQTFMPEHFVIRAAALQDYEAFFASELEQRRRYGYPPFRRMAHLMLDHPKEETVRSRCEALAAHLKGAVERKGVELLGPAPMPLERLKGRYRWHLTLRGSSAGAIKPWIEEALRWDAATRSPVRLLVDVDPLHFR
jgi:primosomal protein N' (replication factor Y)